MKKLKSIYCLALASWFCCSAGLLLGQSSEPALRLADTTQVIQLFRGAEALLSEGKNQEALKMAEDALSTAKRIEGNPQIVGKFIAASTNALSNAYLNLNQLKEARIFAEQTLDLRLKVLGSIHVNVANALTGLARVASAEGKPEEAIKYGLQSLDVNLKARGTKNHRRIADLLSDLGKYHQEASKLKDAANYYDQALEVLTALDLGQSVEACDLYNQRGLLYKELGNPKQTMADYEAALAILEKLRLEEDHPHAGNIYGNLASVYDDFGQYQKSLKYYAIAERILAKSYGAKSYQVAFVNISTAVVHANLGQYDEGLADAHKGLNLLLDVYPPDHPNVAFGHYILGYRYLDKGFYDLAIAQIKAAVDIRLKHFGEKSIQVGNTIGLLGTIYQLKSDLDLALYYQRKELEIFETQTSPSNYNLANTYVNIGVTYAMKEDYKSAYAYFKKAAVVLEQAFGPESANALMPRMFAAQCKALDEKDPDSVVSELKNILTLTIKAYPENHPRVAEAHQIYSRALIKDKRFAEAAEQVKQSIKIIKTAHGAQHPNLAGAFLELVSLAEKNKSTDTIIAYCDSALLALNYQSPLNLSRITDYRLLIVALSTKGQSLLQKSKKDARLLTPAQTLFAEALSALDASFLQVSTPQAKQTLLGNAQKVFEGTLQGDLMSWNHTQDSSYLYHAFEVSEKARALQLYEAMNETKAIGFAGIPDSLLGLEQKLKLEITHYEKQRQSAFSSGKTEGDSLVIQYNQQIFHFQRRLDTLTQGFSRQFPEYYQLKYNLKVQGAKEVQKNLAANESVLEYFVGDSSLYCFVVQPHGIKLNALKKDFPLEQWVKRFQQSIIDMGQAQYSGTPLQNPLGVYLKLADSLYQKLILPLQPDLSPNLTIIPNGALHYLPFEALLQAKPERIDRMHAYPYLLKTHQIDYAYSATLLREMQQKQHLKKIQRRLLAFAPFYDGDTTILGIILPEDLGLRTGFQPLPHSGKEVLRAVETMGGYAFLGPKATEQLFNELAPNYRIIHLSTHARADDRNGDYAFLLFNEIKDSVENELLYARDLYNLRLNADLVVLSACETGVGELRRGEGIISLARAFTYAGAKSIVTSLWKVSDDHTADLMIRFYKNLKKGLPKDEALQRSKLDYLQENKGVAALPFYWASFIPIGDMSAISK